VVTAPWAFYWIVYGLPMTVERYHESIKKRKDRKEMKRNEKDAGPAEAIQVV